MIINLRGTHGSGKTTAVKGVISKLGIAATVHDVQNDKETLGYILKNNVAVVGKYTTACGGCDTIKTQDEICRRVRRFHEMGHHVIFEGILCSQIYERYANLAREFPTDYVFAFLNTELEQAIENVKSRRAAAYAEKVDVAAKLGNTVAPAKELDPANVIQKFKDVERVKSKALADGFTVKTINYHGDTGRQLLDILGLDKAEAA